MKIWRVSIMRDVRKDINMSKKSLVEEWRNFTVQTTGKNVRGGPKLKHQEIPYMYMWCTFLFSGMI